MSKINFCYIERAKRTLCDQAVYDKIALRNTESVKVREDRGNFRALEIAAASAAL